jgi:hypothetical protein
MDKWLNKKSMTQSFAKTEETEIISVSSSGAFNIYAPRGKIIFPPFPFIKNIYIYINI